MVGREGQANEILFDATSPEHLEGTIYEEREDFFVKTWLKTQTRVEKV